VLSDPAIAPLLVLAFAFVSWAAVTVDCEFVVSGTFGGSDTVGREWGTRPYSTSAWSWCDAFSILLGPIPALRAAQRIRDVARRLLAAANRRKPPV
jgi:hypothetical protein